MNQYLKTIQDLLQQNKQLSEQEKDAVIKAIADAEKQWSITDFKLDRTEKVKKTTAILLEETIAELEQKRKAVEAQNRELEIESALERVRSVAMGMKKREDMLDICKTISQQLELLHIKEIRNIQTAIFYEITTIYINYEFYPKHDKLLITEVDYNNHPVAQDFADRMTKGPNHVWTHEFKREEVRDWLKFQKTTNVFIDSYLEKADSLNYYWYSLGPVALGISTYSPLNEEEIILFKRFRNVFELAYRRYIDIEKAEAQAREAQIQLALERVRARTMAMQKSEELKDAAALLFQQVKSLGVPAYSCGYNIWEQNEKEFTSWMSTQDGSDFNAVSNIPLTEDANFIRFADSRQKGEPFFVLELRGERMQEHYEYLKTIPAFKAYFDYAVSMGFDLPETQIHHLANFSQGNLLFITLEPCPEFHDVFKRFAAVFEQTYTRFLDLQKAEAQAREAKIEAALERVRSRSLAMRESVELKEVISVVLERLQQLGIVMESRSAIIFEFDTTQKVFTQWVASPLHPAAISFRTPYVDHPVLADLWKARQNGIEYYENSYSKADKDSLFRYFFDELGMKTDKESVQFIFQTHYYSLAVAFEQNSAITIASHTEKGLTIEESELLRRFARVFEQSYTRFLDLQKAEAQAREAQIEAALERVRARTMAMHSSEDVSAATTVLFNELFKLGIETMRCGILIIGEDQTMETWSTSSAASGQIRKITGRLDMKIHPLLQGVYRAWKQNDEFYKYELKGKDKLEYYKFLSNSPGYSSVTIDANSPDHFSQVFFFKEGGLFTFSLLPHSEEIKQVLKKFTAVFSLTFRRYQDLKKAEAQAREAQIEASLERVRARTMAMHSSEDVSSATATMFNELEKLGIQNFRGGILNIRPDQTMEVWSVNTLDDGTIIRAIGDFDMTMHPFWQQLYQGWINKDESFLFHMSGKDKEDYVRILNARRDYLPNGLQYLPDCIVQSYFFGEGAVWTFSLLPHPEEDKQVMKRFASVFSLTFRRYKDLQKAEAQARESQIEAALERVRARAMAMHKSDDLKMAVATVFEELDKLNLGLIRCGIAILDKEKPRGDIWITIKSEQGNSIGVSGDEPLDIHPLLQGAYDAWLRHEDYTYTLENEDLLNYYQAITQSNFQQAISETFDAAKKDSQQYYFNAVFQDGSLFAFLDTAFTDEAKTVMKRFANVFNLTYKRFLDLQKAEAQAREAQIEAALEKVRASAMAMQKSDGLFSVAEILWEQLKKLGQAELESSIVHLYDNDQSTFDAWYAYCPPNHPRGEMVMGFAKVSYTSTEWTREVVSKYQSTETEYTISASGEKLIEWYRELEKLAPATIDYDENGAIIVPEILYYHFSKFSGGALLMISNEEPSQEACDLHKRAAVVFDLAYTRFLDLKKAEAQAREATIEAALEKVRGKAMAMHNSNDLSVTASMVFTELRKLGINPIRCGVGIIDKETNKAQLYSATASGAGDSLALAGWVMLKGDPVLEQVYDAWLKNEECYPEMQGEQLRSYYKFLLSGFSVGVPESTDEQKQYGHFLPFSVGSLYAWSETRYNETEIKILRRFAAIIDLTFRRYFELQKSEANAREAVKQAALDRVRAEIASMRTISDLDRITPLIWNELTILGISFIRCGVFIMDESQQLIHTFLSTPDGKAIAAFHLPYDTPGHFPDVIDHWRNKKIYVSRWSEDDFLGIANTLLRQGAIATKEQYLGTLPKGGFYLHFLPFLQGLLYVGNTDQLGDEEIILIQHVADAFSTAYARYEDFNKLEAAKQQVDKTLVDLKQAQTQLVQSEKMASLGELTAGIAHEIQNPLNFVNNFSDVSNELLEEMKGELATGNMQQAIAIADDVRQNLEKILHHGKRADAIVKGMLQHSRASSGQKEPTDINALADEYLRLAYHGLRAKEKSFNAKFETDFDQSIGKINIIPQEIGRVVLNLINNAFYACTELSRSTASLPSPKNIGTGAGGIAEPVSNKIPTVWISTKKESNKVLISVRDNGPGIPANILDKIFQPFFTTKPTGQGTGLGLSLSYDILKAHGGEIRVETKEGEGTDFIINLPYRYQ